MADERVHRIVSNFQRGAVTEAGACAELIELAGAIGSDAILQALPADLCDVLRRHPLVLTPPDSPHHVLVVESYCGPALQPEKTERLDRVRRELAHRGVLRLHRALHGQGSQPGGSEQ